MTVHPLNIFIVVLLLAGGGGCASAPTGSKVNASPQVIITKGMPISELLAALGEPASIEETDPPRAGFEVWTYRQKNTLVTLATTGTREVPYFDPITGNPSPIQEPVLNPVRSTVAQITQFLIADGQVISWKVERDETSRVDD